MEDLKQKEDLNIFDEKLNEFSDFIIDSISEYEEKLNSLSEVKKNTKKYYEYKYSKDFFENIRNKFFNREYSTSSEIRIKKIRDWVKEKKFRYNLVLEECNYKINDEYQIEAYEKDYLCQEMLDNYLTFEDEDIKETSSESKNTTKKEKVESILKGLEDHEKEEKEKYEKQKKEKELEEKLKNSSLDEKISILYNKISNFAKEKDGEDDGIIHSYIDEIYNPKKTKLDKNNLYLNLKILNLLQKFNIIDWDFDTGMNKVSSDEYDLSMEHWSKIMSENLEDDEKYFKIIEKNFKYAFYLNILSELAKKSDRTTVSKKNLKTRNLLIDENDGERRLEIEEYFIEKLEKNTDKGNVIFITKDLEDYIDLDERNEEEINSDKHIKFLGKWKNRWIFSLEQDNFKITKGIEKYAFFIKNGNKYTFNPEKPILYYNLIDNPFLEKPILKLFSNVDLNLYMSNTTIMNVELD